jgi:hypothetical protein
MKYQAVILNFDKKTATYVSPQAANMAKKAVTSTSGTNPPARKKHG